VMSDAELISFDEPFPALRNQGVVWASDGQRMSKSKGNVVTPDAMIEKYGADALRHAWFRRSSDRSGRGRRADLRAFELGQSRSSGERRTGCEGSPGGRCRRAAKAGRERLGRL